MMSPHRRDQISLFLLFTAFSLLIHSTQSHISSAEHELREFTGEYGPVIAIDIGNTNARVAVPSKYIPQHSSGLLSRWENFNVRSIPACVAFTNNGTLVGHDAQQQESTNPQNTRCGIRSSLGQKWHQSPSNPQRNFSNDFFDEGGDPMVAIYLEDEEFTVSVDEIQGILMGQLKQYAEELLEMNVTHAVATVPSYYTDSQRKAVMDAGLRANLTVLRIINEPWAASVAYMLDEQVDYREHLVLVYDINGWTTDITVLEIDQGIGDILGTTSSDVGGNLLRQEVAKSVGAKIKEKYNIDIFLSENQDQYDKVVAASEKAMKRLSSTDRTNVEIENLAPGLSYNETISRTEFEELNKDMFYRAIEPVSHALKDLQLNISEIDHVVLVGGSAHIPKIQSQLAEAFEGKELIKSDTPENAVVIGAAYQALILSSEESTSACFFGFDINPLTLGIETAGGIFKPLILRNTPLPTRKLYNFTTVVDGQTSMAVKIFEGERAHTDNNLLIEEIVISGIRPAPRGTTSVQVTMEYDWDGRLKVQAIDLSTGNNETVLTNQTAFCKLITKKITQDEIDEIVYSAERMAEDDSILREEAIAELGTDNSVGAFEAMTIDAASERDEL